MTPEEENRKLRYLLEVSNNWTPLQIDNWLDIISLPNSPVAASQPLQHGLPNPADR